MDDPKRPYKAIAAAVAAVVTYLITQQVLELPVWAVLVCNVILVALVTFGVRNPKV